MKKKICTKCKKIKNSIEFPKRTNSKDGLRSECKECKKIYAAKHYQENSDKIKETHRLYHLKYKDEINANSRKWHQENKDKNNAKRRKWHQENKDRDNANSRKWRQENRDYVIATSVEYRRNRLATDPVFKVLCSIRSRQSAFFSYLKNKLVNGKEITKSASFHKLLGCDENTFVTHMESQFTSNINWNNHGTYWHVDHIKPLILFDMSNIDEQRIAFNYLNLQPLTIYENLSKGAKYEK